MSLNIQESAIFIADSHFNKNRQELKTFLLKLDSKKIKTSQLFLMGDIFDFLSDEITYFKNQNQNMIDLLNKLANNISIIYLEGNHDFNLTNLFPNIQVIPRQNQPLNCIYKDKKVIVSHGDIFMPLSYEIFTFIFRNKYFLKFLNTIDINNWLSKKFDNNLIQKDICNECDNFKKFSNKRISLYPSDVDIIIEGHFHFGNQVEKYINIPSLACDEQSFRINTVNS